MSMRDRHALVMVTPTTTGELDDWGQPIPGEPVETSLRGLVYPLEARSASREEPHPAEAGVMAADHAIVIEPREVTTSAWFRFDPDDGVRYDVVGLQSYPFGSRPLLQVMARRVIPSTLPVAEVGS
jgi:hypothetical protein